MADALRFLIIDGYPAPSRDEFRTVGMTPAGELYAELLLRHLPGAAYDLFFPSDPGTELPAGVGLDAYAGAIWTGCNLTIYHLQDSRVVRMIELQKRLYEVGAACCGSCWGIQMAAVAAGGEVAKNPRGREMGLARKIRLTEAGRSHPALSGKPAVFDAFISHYDEVSRLPAGAVHLAANGFTEIQALAVTHGRGTFWAWQYHPEYNLHEMARLFAAREDKLLAEGFYRSHDELAAAVDDMEALAADPGRKDLRFRLAIDDDVLSDAVRELDFKNWIERLVLPRLGRGHP